MSAVVPIADLTDDGLALEMARAWAGDARYDARTRRWSFRNGDAWERDGTLQHVARARDFLRAKAVAAGSGTEATRLLSARTVAAVIKLASCDEALAFRGDASWAGRSGGAVPGSALA